MKQTRRWGFVWTKLSDEELRVMVPRILVFVLSLPVLIWGLTRIVRWIVRY
jgi:hypothetical protein